MNFPARYTSHLQMQEVVDCNGIPLKNRDGRQLYRVLSPLSFYSAELNVVITVHAGFISDLDSTPRIPLVYLLINGFGDMPAVTHDYLYSMGMFTRLECDNILLEACLATGVPSWKAHSAWVGVRLGGASHYGNGKPA